MDNKIKNISDAEAMLKILSMSEKSIKQGKAKFIRKAFKDLKRRINEFHKEQSLNKLGSTSKNKFKKNH